MAYYLEPQNDGQQIVLDKAVVLVGRGSDCDVVLNNSRKVSRKHCCIAQVNDTYVLRDLASMNGVRVNGKKVKREAVLTIGDEVSFGDVSYVLRQTVANGSEPSPEAPVRVPQGPPPVPSRPADISQKFPVPIADEGVEFAVEASMEMERSPLADVQIESADEAPSAESASPASDAPPGDSAEILLDDDEDSDEMRAE
ncbi:MAG: FHA domain-containing protein [Planctomycetaceae bacterium]